jgi:glycosyltransferase involved in cell wall biosynthesis
MKPITTSAGVEPLAGISAIVPIGQRQDNMREIYREYRDGLDACGTPYQLIFVLDGHYAERVTLVKLSKPFGESTALMAGFEQAEGGIIVTLPAYFQIMGSSINDLVKGLGNADVVAARRYPRAGSWFEQLRRAAYHRLVNWLTELPLRDLGCGARALRRSVLAEITLYGDQHRLFPALADRQGFRVAEIDVPQSPRDHNSGRYRTRDYAHRILDIITVFFLVRFTKKPLRFFGMVGALTVALGGALLLYLAVDRLVFGNSIADRPALLYASLMVVLGVQVFALGLLGELLIFTHARSLKDYHIERIVHFPAVRE